MADPKIEIGIDTGELTDFFESFLEDFKATAESIIGAINSDKSTKLTVDPADIKKLELMTNAVNQLAQKKFVVDNIPDFSAFTSMLKEFQSTLKDFSLPERINVNLPEIKFPKTEVQKLDFTPIINGIGKLEEVFLKGLHINNLREIPIVFPKTEGVGVIPGFQIPPFDTVNATYPDAVTEVYTYMAGDSSVCVITITYTDSTKEFIEQATKL